MIASERKNYILSKMADKGTVSLNDISKELGISMATIRRDFDKLANEGVIERVHGGGVLASALMNNQFATLQTSLKLHENDVEKMEIAKAAAALVKDGECVFLDGGSTVAQMINFLYGKKITIVTPNYYILESIMQSNANSFDVYFIGGKYSTFHASTVGSICEQLVQQFNYNKAFFGCSGIDFDKGIIYNDDPDTITLKMPAFINSEERFILADSSKVNRKSFYRFLEVNKFDRIIITSKGDSQVEYPVNVTTVQI